MKRSSTIQIEIAPGELIDKITILEIKSIRIADAAKLRNVEHELASLKQSLEQEVTLSDSLNSLSDKLRKVNESLWEIEDKIRICELKQDFGLNFIDLARSVYRTNDLRAQLKRQINDLLGSTIVEEKEYVKYSGDVPQGS